ncbi:hypothetical protein THTE_3950 [Thermogutta terrifontis]|uniref:Uncharacterized protein n=1 Tax=Thermogutta terrifontis TaxID=1331910 RepID=A0A286RKR0_9BACT|nr:hypothetical protein THTE_3950 [Thermogutta terrifontis]
MTTEQPGGRAAVRIDILPASRVAEEIAARCREERPSAIVAELLHGPVAGVGSERQSEQRMGEQSPCLSKVFAQRTGK